MLLCVLQKYYLPTTFLILYIGLCLYKMVHINRIYNWFWPNTTKLWQKITKLITKLILCRLLLLSHYLRLVPLPLTCAPSTRFVHFAYQNILPTGPQHKIVAHPQATSTGYCVLIDIYLEIFIMFFNFIYYKFFIYADSYAFVCILLIWMVNKFGIHYLSTLLHILKHIHILKFQLLTNILELIKLSGVTLMMLSFLGCSLLQWF